MSPPGGACAPALLFLLLPPQAHATTRATNSSPATTATATTSVVAVSSPSDDPRDLWLPPCVDRRLVTRGIDDDGRGGGVVAGEGEQFQDMAPVSKRANLLWINPPKEQAPAPPIEDVEGTVRSNLHEDVVKTVSC
jgi:hypothetical protein